MSSIAEETFGNVRTVKAFATEEAETHRFQLANTDVYNIG
jgi:ABC-type multidrug transport system fused ATPase/permease subunit